MAGIEPLLDNLFGFLRRKTDFYNGASLDKINAIVSEAIHKHYEVNLREKAAAEEKKKAEERRKLKKKMEVLFAHLCNTLNINYALYDNSVPGLVYCIIMCFHYIHATYPMPSMLCRRRRLPRKGSSRAASLRKGKKRE